MRIKDVMSTVVEQVSSGDPVEVAKTRLRVRGVKQLIVVDGRAVKGIVDCDAVDRREERRQAHGGGRDDTTPDHGVAGPSRAQGGQPAARQRRRRAAGARARAARGDRHRVGSAGTIGRGGARPVDKGTRWTLRNRGVLPAQARAKR